MCCIYVIQALMLQNFSKQLRKFDGMLPPLLLMGISVCRCWDGLRRIGKLLGKADSRRRYKYSRQFFIAWHAYQWTVTCCAVSQAYIQQLESTRTKLAQIESELENAKRKVSGSLFIVCRAYNSVLWATRWPRLEAQFFFFFWGVEMSGITSGYWSYEA